MIIMKMKTVLNFVIPFKHLKYDVTDYQTHAYVYGNIVTQKHNMFVRLYTTLYVSFVCLILYLGIDY